MREFYTIFILRVSVKHFGPYNKMSHIFYDTWDENVRVLKVILGQYGRVVVIAGVCIDGENH